MRKFFRLTLAGPFFFVSSWIFMLFVGLTRSSFGIRPIGYVTSMVATIGLWLVAAPAISAVASKKQKG